MAARSSCGCPQDHNSWPRSWPNYEACPSGPDCSRPSSTPATHADPANPGALHRERWRAHPPKHHASHRYPTIDVGDVTVTCGSGSETTNNHDEALLVQ